MTIPMELVSDKTNEAISQEGKIVRTHTLKYLAKPGSDVSAHYVKLNCGHLIGEVYAEDTSATLRDITPERKRTRGEHAAFDVTLVYSTDAPAPDNGDEDPVNQRVKRSQGNVEQTLYIVKDRNGEAIVNAAGQPFPNGIQVSVTLPTFVWEKNLRNYDRELVSLWTNSLNQDEFCGCEPETLQLRVSADEQFQGKFHWWTHRFEMAYYPLGWQPQPVNAGLIQLVTTGLKPITDPFTKKPVSEAWPLYGAFQSDGVTPEPNAGRALPDNYTPDQVNFIDVDYFRLKQFSQLGLEEF